MIPCFITVRNASGRLPSKCLLPLGDCNIVQHVIRRCSSFLLRPILCTTTELTDTVLESIANIESIEIYRGHPEDVQKRWLACAASLGVRVFHTVDCDDPYFDPAEVSRSVAYTMANNLGLVLPTASSSLYGLGLMGSTFNLDGKESRILPERKDEMHVRLTLDYPEDYWLLMTLAKLNCSYDTPRETVERTIKTTTIARINSFRHVDWKATQTMERESRKLANG